MSIDEHGTLSTAEITRAIEYLQIVGLSGAQIYGFWAYVATGQLVSEVTRKE